MHMFHNSLFSPLHKWYSEIIMNSFKECRTIRPVYETKIHYFQFNPHTKKDDEMWFVPEPTVEIDIGKLLTLAFNKIKQAPVLT